ncbi:flagellar basal body P-ring biosynthesis protein FlgA [Symmachiella dynata]|uniref:flagellar basal body P-ring formation chaperone FlgA n=1 Tax=Symmachiella dynata TaxID=2527995 RepID=UPI0011882939|nr:flagellar basal body P-ring formation chaperone FlgA [Symmachiella dynata]QDT47486.1 flagellar basal body P-ring biosynthesis protein FlgA [Symmachiella dynata]
MSVVRPVNLAIFLLGVMISQSTAGAALIHLRSQCTASSTVVQLGDIAEIRDADPATAQRLANVTFQPAPGSGRKTRVRVEDVKSRLQALGENLATVQFSGASIVQVHGPQPVRSEAEPQVSNHQLSQAERRVTGAIQQHLDEQATGAQITALMLPRDATTLSDLLSTNVAYWEISGGQAPWTGRQTIQIHASSPDGGQVFEVVVELSPKPRALVLRHPVSQGHVLGLQDLAWLPVAELPRQQAVLTDPRALVGQQAVRALPEGRPLTERDIKRLPLIKRGDTVTVYSRFGAVSIKTVARAVQEGAYGDQIPLRTLEGNTTILAKVIDFHIAEITPEMSQPDQNQAGLKVRFAPATRYGGQ